MTHLRLGARYAFKLWRPSFQFPLKQAGLGGRLKIVVRGVSLNCLLLHCNENVYWK